MNSGENVLIQGYKKAKVDAKIINLFCSDPSLASHHIHPYSKSPKSNDLSPMCVRYEWAVKKSIPMENIKSS